MGLGKMKGTVVFYDSFVFFLSWDAKIPYIKVMEYLNIILLCYVFHVLSVKLIATLQPEAIFLKKHRIF